MSSEPTSIEPLADLSPEDLLTRAFASVSEAVFVVETPDRHISACNPAASSVFGYEFEELVGASTELLHVDRSHYEQFDEQTRPVVEDGEVFHGRFEMQRRDGSVFETEHTVSPFHREEDGVKSVVSVVRAVSELEEISSELTGAQSQLRRLVQLSQKLGGQVDLEELHDEIVESAVALIPQADAAALWLHGEEGDEFVVRAWHGAEDRVVVEDTDPDRSALFRQVLLEGVSFRENDLEFARRPRSIEPPLFEGVRAILGVPVRLGRSPLGVLVVTGFRAGELFSARDESALELLAGQAATSLQNARLVQELHERSSMLIQAQESERRRIARELHDELGGSLSALDLALENEKGEDPHLADRLSAIQERVRGMSGQLRKLILDLRPSSLDELGLPEALEGYFERFTERTGVEVEPSGAGLGDRSLPGTVETALYRIVQEALTNVARHAETDRARVFLERTSSELTVRIEDEGVGFDPEAVRDRAETVGLSGMRERAALLGGSLTVGSVPGEGTTISATVPLDS